MLLADLTDLIQLHCLTGKIHRNDCFGLLRDMAADTLWINVVGVTLYISKYRRPAAIQNAVGGSSKRQGVTITSSPFVMPAAIAARCSAAVPLLTITT